MLVQLQNPLQDSVYHFSKQYLYAFKFFTTWVFILAICHRYLHQYVNLLYLSFITMIVGFYLSFINPRRFVFYFENERYEYTGIQKFIIVDMIFHILVFTLLAEKYGSFYNGGGIDSRLCVALLVICIYIYMYDPQRVYGITMIEIYTIFFVANILYFLVYN